MKLEIPAPEESLPGDETQISMELWIGLVLSVLVIFFGWLFWIQPQMEEEDDPFQHIEDPEEREAERERAQFDEWVERGRMERIDWTDRPQEAVRVLEVGTRQATEVVCSQFRESLGASTAPRAMTQALLRAVSRRIDDAPWTCLLEMYLDDGVFEEGALVDEMALFWRDVQWVDAHGFIMAKVIADFLAAEEYPQSKNFDRWLRRCAMTMRYEAAPVCQQLAAQKKIRHGEDLLEMVIRQLDAPDVDIRDLALASQALAYFARYGQPREWRIEETDTLPDYDVDFRLGAVFMLCRLINSPDEEVREFAVDGLGRIAEVTGRPTSPHMQYRWRKSCRFAFGDADDPPARLPMLGVVSIKEDEEQSDYGMETLVDAGYCEREEGLPIWYCGAERWTGGGEAIRRVLGNYFALTSYIEWYEIEELAEVISDQ